MNDKVFSPGDIVIVETEDGGRGKVRVPALIRYYDEKHGAYEVSVLFRPDRDAPADMDDLAWWTVSAHEVNAWLGQAVTERPRRKKSGEKTWKAVIFLADEPEQEAV